MGWCCDPLQALTGLIGGWPKYITDIVASLWAYLMF
jgi:hypothetical protein